MIGILYRTTTLAHFRKQFTTRMAFEHVTVTAKSFLNETRSLFRDILGRQTSPHEVSRPFPGETGKPKKIINYKLPQKTLKSLTTLGLLGRGFTRLQISKPCQEWDIGATYATRTTTV